MKLFTTTTEDCPSVIMPRVDKKTDRTTWEVVTILGRFHRVFPASAKEVFALQMLEHRVEKFAPATCNGDDRGNGILITAEAFRKFNS